VEDSGAGLSDEEMARLGERFYRVLGTGQTGSGLGWSIVRRIAHVYKASVEVTRSSTLGGLCVTIRWTEARAASGTSTAI
jgi:two-component system sensor histidine kinase QseC